MVLKEDKSYLLRLLNQTVIKNMVSSIKVAMAIMDKTESDKKVFKVGEKAQMSKVFTEKDVRQFAEVSTDTNPIHLDEDFAKNSVIGQRIVHGMLVASMFSAIIGNKLPGKGTIYLGQSINFKKPILINDQITASVEITNIREDKPIITLETLCFNEKAEIVIEGEAVVKIA